MVRYGVYLADKTKINNYFIDKEPVTLSTHITPTGVLGNQHKLANPESLDFPWNISPALVLWDLNNDHKIDTVIESLKK